jgi:hypothetical protein
MDERSDCRSWQQNWFGPAGVLIAGFGTLAAQAAQTATT